MQFLMGLDDVFAPIRSQILTTEPLPDVKTDFATLSRDESHKINNIHSNNNKSGPSTFATRPNKNGHTIDRCFELVGYPPNFKRKDNQNVSSNAAVAGNKVDQKSRSSVTHSFTDDQFQKMIALISDKSRSGCVTTNIAVKDNKIDLLVQQYEQFVISEDESIDGAFTRFNTIITSLKALDEGYSSKNYVRKFLRALHPKWRAKVTTIEESKDLTSLSLDELIGNLKVHEMIIKKDFEIAKAKGERKALALKAKKESSDEECSTSRSEDEEYAWRLETSRSSSKEEVGSCDDPNHLIEECPKPPKDKNQKAFIGGSWSDSGEEDDDKAKDETCLAAQALDEICLRVDLEPDE
ncbi:hypothetical protein Tco_0991425 [Tanacetum coccineum]|uniref:UBN2 domain-containing protein n=1 Tax=Tanacetum coccineum TaxID=301880 RepID=A0ABQ5EZ87_9ASTR